jgi:geranylgeranyl reductase family protein
MEYDVIIAGAGPAGSTCARICAQQGLKTLLLDRDGFPRSKPCAGAVSEQALKCLDFKLPEHIIEKECFGIRVHYQDRFVEVKRDQRFAILVSRRDFDSILVNKAVEAGARFIAGEQVIAVQDRQDIVEVSTGTQSHRGQFLIGADGIHSRVAQALRPSLRKDEIAIALVCQVLADDREISNRLGKTLDLYFGKAPVGYGWLFPHRGYYSIGIAGLASRFSKPREALTDLLHSLQLKVPEIQGHFIPFGGIQRSIARGRLLLAGDAAGFADPFHGEGIAYAILSGKLAAQTLSETIGMGKSPSFAVSRYRSETGRLITEQLRVALHMAYQFERHPDLYVRIFLDHPEALRRYLDIPAGRSDYRSFQRWILTHLPLLLLPGRRKKTKETAANNQF